MKKSFLSSLFIATPVVALTTIYSLNTTARLGKNSSPINHLNVLPINPSSPNNNLTDEQKLNKIVQDMQNYNLSLYGDDIKNWDDPAELEKKVLNELQLATSFLMNDNFINFNNRIDWAKVQLTGGYQLNKQAKTLMVNIAYNQSKPVKFKFNVWKASRKQVMDALNQKIAFSLPKINFKDLNWNSPAFNQQLGNKYLQTLKDKIGSTITVGAENIPLNKYRIYLSSWSNQGLISSNKMLFKYDYLTRDYPLILKVNLIKKPSWTEITRKLLNHIPRDLLKISLPSNITHQMFNQKLLTEKIQDIKKVLITQFSTLAFDKLGIKIPEIVNKAFNINQKILELFNINRSLKVLSMPLPKIGEFDTEVTVNLRINNSKVFIPLTFKFATFSDEKITQLETKIQQIFNHFYLKTKNLAELSSEYLWKVIKKQISLQNLQFNSDLLTIQSFQQNAQDLQLVLNFKHVAKPINLTIKTIK